MSPNIIHKTIRLKHTWRCRVATLRWQTTKKEKALKEGIDGEKQGGLPGVCCGH